MPPETESGAIVLPADPINRPELKSEDMIVLPEPLGVRVKFPFAPVAMVSGPESLKLLAESVWVAALIERPLMVLVVAARVRFPPVVKTLAEEKKLILPVEAFPNWSVCLFIVAKTPVAVSDVAPVVPEREAVGVTPATFVNANL